jgi:4-amino-4-deoxy-L-arabinose transferase-like glycosyltransferase
MCYDSTVTFLSPHKPWQIGVAVFCIALLVRLFFLPFSLLHPQPFNPSGVAFDGYYPLSLDLLAGHGFSWSTAPPYEPDSVRTPLYPLLIVGLFLIFKSYKILFLLQVLLGSLTCVLAWLIAKSFLREEWAAATVGVLLALEPLNAYLTGVILTETVFTFLFLLMVWLFLRYVQNKSLAFLALVSFLIGVSVLVKPTIQYLPILLLPLLWLVEGRRFTKKLFVHAAVLVGVFLLVISPWLYRNEILFNNASLVVQPVSNLYAYLVPSAIALEEHIPFQPAQDQFFAEQHVKSIDDINLGNAKEFEHRALAELSHHPLGLAESVGVTMYAFFLNDGYYIVVTNFFGANFAPHFSLHALFGPELVVLLGRAFWFVATLLMLWGIYRYVRTRGVTPELLFFAGLIAYFAVTTIVIGLAVNGRFRVPVDTFILMFAVYGATALYIEAKSRWL